MLQFLNNSSENSWSLRVDSGQRLWLHQTAKLLGMQSRSEGYHAKHDLRTLSITKTADTELPANIQEALQRSSTAAETRRQANKAAKQEAKRVAKAK